MDTQTFKAVSTRLEPLRRFLSDVAIAAEQAKMAEQAVVEWKAQLEALQLQVADLQKEVQHFGQLEAEYRAKAEEADKHAREMITAANADAAVQLDGLKKEVAEQQRLLQEQLAQAQVAHRSKLALLDREEKQAQENLRVTKEALESIYSRIGVIPKNG